MSLGVFQFWKDVASQLRSSVPFVSEALNVLPLIETKRVPFAGTDNRSIMVNTEGWQLIQEQCQRAGEWYPTDQGAAATVLLHECLHVILKHKQRGVGVPRREIYRQAIDIFVNNTLVDIFRLPPFNYNGEKMEQYKRALAASGTFDERFRGKDTDQIYSTLCEEQPEEEDQKEQAVDPNQPCNGGGGGQSKPEKGDDEEKDGSDGDSGSGDEDGDEEKDNQSGGSDGEGDEEEDDEQDKGGDAPEPPPPSKPLDNDIAEEDGDSGVPDDVNELIENAMSDYLERNATFAPSGSGLAHEIAEARKKPPILMSQVLRKIRDVISGTIFDYRRPSRADAWGQLFGYEGRMPSYHDDPSDKVRELVLAFDYSGSFGEAERQAAFSIARDAFKHVKRDIRLLCFTDRVVSDEVITASTVLTSRHSGGTHIASIIDYMENPTLCTDPSKNGRRIKPSAVVIITDAYDPPSMPLLERWKYKNRMRNIVINSRMEMPGLTFHCDCVDGYPRS